jgi:hypothetical protein
MPVITRNWELQRQSSWLTYFLGRDHMRVDVPESWKTESPSESNPPAPKKDA